MSRTAWIIIVVLVVLVLLYVVYNKMFKDKTQAAGSFIAPNVVVPRVKPVPSAVLNSDPTANQNANTDYTNTQSSLMTIMKVLGYNIKPTTASGDVEATGYWNDSDVLKRFALRFPGNTNINGNLVDNAKWLEYQPLTYIKYNINDNPKAHDYYLKLISFWGKDFFGAAAKSITDAAKKAAIPTVDCNSNTYKDKLNRLYANLKGVGQMYQLAVINLNNVSNAETNQAFERAANAFKIAETEYNAYNKLCKTN